MTVSLFLSTTQTAGRRSNRSWPPLAGIFDHRCGVELHASDDDRAELHGSRWIVAKPTLTSKVRVTGSAWGETSRTRPLAVTFGSVPSDLRCRTGSLVRRLKQLAGYIESSIPPIFSRHANNHLAGLYHLARLGAGRRYNPGGIRFQFGVAHAIFGGFELGFRHRDLGAGSLHGLLRALELGARGDIARDESALTLEFAPGLRELRLCGRYTGLGGTEARSVRPGARALHHQPRRYGRTNIGQIVRPSCPRCE